MENTAPKKKNKVLPIILVLVVCTVGIYAFNKISYARHHEDTDDAQLDNDINPVLSRVAGYVDQIRFEDNQLVNKGDTLVLLDDRDLEIKVEQAAAALENAKAAVSVAEANVSSAIANFETAKSTVESSRIRVWKSSQDFTRFQNLLNDKAVTQQQYDAAKAEKETADAQQSISQRQQNAASAMVDAAKKQITVANANVSQKQADLDYAKLQLSYATIIAPATGIASKKNIQQGQFVNAGSSLFAIVAENNVYVLANFKETQLEKMQKGNPVEVIVDAFPDTKLEGTVYNFSAATGAKFSLLPPDNATGNFVKVIQRIPVKIALKGLETLKDKLRPGMSVKVSVKID
ncbi:MAG: HlyD family secretion protein [Bacteroidetes bacterium]|nr:HlyD family secretion protein [Bacteroidota bacterium]